jgi:ABC-type Fe3+/spermidine/putrescine transport system ATPase subunit
MAEAAALSLDGIRRSFGQVVAVDGVSLDMARGEFVTLLGPSGSGKTSTLRLIGGFEKLESGSIRISGERVDHLPPYRRDTATIFQSGALFPHKTVAENVAYGLRMRKAARPDIAARVKQALDIVRLSGFENRLPAQLSGGQKQRVALARSLAVRPAILLFDEPLSALDLSLRLQLRAEIKRLHDELKFSAIYVTHDQGEAMAMSSRIAVMNRGRIEQIGTPDAIFNRPANEFVYTFIGESCAMPVTIASGGLADRAGNAIEMTLGTLPGHGEWRLYVRPSRIRIGADALNLPNRLTASVHFVEFLGDTTRYHLRAGALELFADSAGQLDVRPGDTIAAGWRDQDMKAFQ